MKTIATKSHKGAYGYKYTVSVEISRNEYYGVVSSFAWKGNKGGREEYRIKLTEQQAQKAIELIEAASKPPTEGDTGIHSRLADAGDYIQSLREK